MNNLEATSVHVIILQMLTQLNTTLEEENKAMVEQLNKIVGQVSRTCYSCYTLLVVLTLSFHGSESRTAVKVVGG